MYNWTGRNCNMPATVINMTKTCHNDKRTDSHNHTGKCLLQEWKPCYLLCNYSGIRTLASNFPIMSSSLYTTFVTCAVYLQITMALN